MNLKGVSSKEEYVQLLHNQWGVRYTCNGNNGTGVLLFVSEYDRFVYISRGTMLNSVLTNYRLDTILNIMKPYLKQGLYDAAILVALSKIQYYVEIGKPLWKERIEGFRVQYGLWIQLIGISIIIACNINNESNGNRRSGSSTSYRIRGGSSSWSFSSFGGGRSGGRGSTW